jgi:hypothetical protein
MTRYHATAEGDAPFTAEEEAEWDAREAAYAANALPKLKSQLVNSVDDAVAVIYAKWMRFEAEYREREAAAVAFVSAGYVGDPGVWVTAFATSAGKTNAQSADLIIAQAAGLRAALQNLGALRMQKYGILSAQSPASANSVHDTIILQANAIAAAIS